MHKAIGSISSNTTWKTKLAVCGGTRQGEAGRVMRYLLHHPGYSIDAGGEDEMQSMDGEE